MAHIDPAPHRGRTTRLPLSRARIVEAAIEHMDAHGLASLTMRRLSDSLGVDPMSLYHYLNGREDLLEAVVGRLAEEIRVPPDRPLGPRDGWQAYVQEIAHSVRRLALDHPHIFPLVATRPPAASWLRPPLRSLEVVEDFLCALLNRGVSEEHAVEAYKEIATFLLGHLLLETALMGAPTGPDREPLNEGDADAPTPDGDKNLADYPTVARLKAELTRHDAEADFASGLETVLDRLDLRISQ